MIAGAPYLVPAKISAALKPRDTGSEFGDEVATGSACVGLLSAGLVSTGAVMETVPPEIPLVTSVPFPSFANIETFLKSKDATPTNFGLRYTVKITPLEP